MSQPDISASILGTVNDFKSMLQKAAEDVLMNNEPNEPKIVSRNRYQSRDKLQPEESQDTPLRTVKRRKGSEVRQNSEVRTKFREFALPSKDSERKPSTKKIVYVGERDKILKNMSQAAPNMSFWKKPSAECRPRKEGFLNMND